MFEIKNVHGIGEYTVEKEIHDDKPRELYRKGEKVFLVVNEKTLEVRCDARLSTVLMQKYESVMESRYFGRGGIEIVLAGKQFSVEEINDLVRLSYNLS